MKKKTNWLPGTLLITGSAFALSSIVYLSVYTNVKDIADVEMICLVFVVLPLSAILVLHLLAVFRQQIKVIIRLIHWNLSVKLLMSLTFISLVICVYSYFTGLRIQIALSKTRDIRLCIGRGNIALGSLYDSGIFGYGRLDYSLIYVGCRRHMCERLINQDYRYGSIPSPCQDGYFLYGHWIDSNPLVVCKGFYFSFPILLLVILSGILPAREFYRGIKKYKSIVIKPCLGCGYDLTGNVSGVCPECSTEI